MRVARIAFFLSLIFLISGQLNSQQTSVTVQTVERDAQALTILNQTLSVSGGNTLISSIGDFTATGSITYFWAGQQVQGTVTLRQKGADEFRLDANLPSGIRSWAVSLGTGSVKEADGTVYPVGFANALNLGALTFPLAEIYIDLQDSSTTLIYIGSTQIAGHTVQQIHAQRNFSPQNDPDGTLSRLRSRDFFVDASNFQLLVIRDQTHSNENFYESYAHEINFADYRLVNGLLVPFSISESIAGQQTWTIQLSSVNFNLGLTDLDFEL